MHRHRCIPLIKSHIDAHLPTCHTVDEIVRRFNIDRHVLHEQFLLAYGQSPKQYIQNRRLALLKALILESNDGHVAFFYAAPLGFQSASALHNFVQRSTGLSFRAFKDAVLSGIFSDKCNHK